MKSIKETYLDGSVKDLSQYLEMLAGVCCPSSSEKRRIVELLLVGAGFRRCSPEIEMRQRLVAVAGVGSLLLITVLRRSLLPGGPAKREKKKEQGEEEGGEI